MKKIIFIVAFLLPTLALAQSATRDFGKKIEQADVWSIGPKAVDQDFSIIVNDGGVPTPVLTVDAATGAVSLAVPLDGSSIAAATDVASGVVSTTTQTFGGAKTFSTPLAGSSVASASAVASGVVTTGAQTFGGVKTLAGDMTVDNSAVAERDVQVNYQDGSTGASSGGFKEVFNRFDTSGTGVQDIFTVEFESAGHAKLALCDASTTGTNTGFWLLTWSADADSIAVDVDSLLSNSSVVAFSGNTLQITPGDAAYNQWCIHVVYMGRSTANADIVWSL